MIGKRTLGYSGLSVLVAMGLTAAAFAGRSGTPPRETAPVLDSSVAPDPTRVEPVAPPSDAPPSTKPKSKKVSNPPSKKCIHSFDLKCGPFYWIKQPSKNRPMQISIEVSPENPTVGEPVIVTVNMSDPDAPIFGASLNGSWGDGGALIPPLRCGPEPAGGWMPPDPKPGSDSITFTHTYSEPGTFEVGFAGSSSSGEPWGPFWCSGEGTDPYASEASASVTIVVSPAPETTPTPTPTSTPA